METLGALSVRRRSAGFAVRHRRLRLNGGRPLTRSPSLRSALVLSPCAWGEGDGWCFELANLPDRAARGVRRRASAFARSGRSGAGGVARRRADALDARLGVAVSALCRTRQGRAPDRRGRDQLRRLLPRRHAVHVRPCAPGTAQGAGRAGGGGPRLHAADALVQPRGRASDAAFRPAGPDAVAGGDHGVGRQPGRDPLGARRDAKAETPDLRRLLSRHGRGRLRHAAQRPAAQQARPDRAGPRPDRDDDGDPLQRPDRAGDRAGKR